jgi:DNA-binding YbaB/EbfC family protein
VKNLGQLMKQAQDMQARMSEMQARLESAEIEGQSGAGMVQAVLSGKGDLRRLKIDPSLLVPDEAEILEDLIVAAHNDAKGKLETRLADEMGKITGGMPLPPGFKLPF